MNKYGLKFKNTGEYAQVEADRFYFECGAVRFYKGDHRFDIYDVQNVLRIVK